MSNTMQKIGKQTKISTIGDLIQYLKQLEEEWDKNETLKEYAGEFLNQSLHGEVFEKEGDSYQYKGIGKDIDILYDICFGLIFMARSGSDK